MIAPELVFTLDDLAALFRRSPETISRHVARLMERHGFPQPLPLLRPRVWSRPQVEAWIAAGPSAATGLPVPAQDPRLSPEAIAASRARLEARYGGHAA
ncbi:MAG: hypothetical protein AB1592_11365 [Pseudomonadota bacterium]